METLNVLRLSVSSLAQVFLFSQLYNIYGQAVFANAHVFDVVFFTAVIYYPWSINALFSIENYSRSLFFHLMNVPVAWNTRAMPSSSPSIKLIGFSANPETWWNILSSTFVFLLMATLYITQLFPDLDT